MQTVKIIAYGTLMTGERNHHFCDNAVSIEPCTVRGTLYDTGYGFPAYTIEGEAIIQAELITLPIEYWQDIDRLEGYPRLYTREIVTATFPDGTATEAWIYIMTRLPPQAKPIKNGNWKHRN
ncbi:MAG: gamma-glutamylcyclotransferase [Victivallaceae bacterium]